MPEAVVGETAPPQYAKRTARFVSTEMFKKCLSYDLSTSEAWCILCRVTDCSRCGRGCH